MQRDPKRVVDSDVKILDLIRERQRDAFALQEEHLNVQMVRVLKTLGFDRTYVEGRGPHLFDADGNRYLDLLSGFGVFAIGRNHPKLIEVLRDILGAGLPNLVQLDVSLLAGILAERLVARSPDGLEKVFFCSSGSEAVESAMKIARKVNVSFPLLIDQGQKVSEAYGVDAMPFTVLVDRDGRVAYIHRGYKPGDEAKYVDKLKKLLRR